MTTHPRSAFGAPPQGGAAGGPAKPDPRRPLDSAQLRELIAQRVGALEALFAHIGATRMEGVPILHPELRVQAIGFEALSGGDAAVGVLITPWFMNLVRLPLDAAGADLAAPGVTRERVVGNQGFPFIGAHEPGLGGYECCSLFSPMFEFEDHAAALATARAVLEALRKPPEPPPAPRASRRALLFGRGAAAAGATP